MRTKDIKIRTKIFFGFFAVVFLFVLAAFYQITSLKSLSVLQNEGISRSKNAVIAKEIDLHLEASYAIVADAVINRNVQEAAKAFNQFKQAAENDMNKIGRIAETNEEKQWAADFSQHYKNYITICDKQILPLLTVREDALKRAQDVITVAAFAQKMTDVSIMTSDAIINNDIEAAKLKFAEIKESVPPLLSSMQKIGETLENYERALVISVGEELEKYMSIIENRLFPALTAGNKTIEVIRPLDEALDIALGLVLVPVELIAKKIRDTLKKSEEQERTLGVLNTALARERAACKKPLESIIKSFSDKNIAGVITYEETSSRTSQVTVALCIFDFFAALLIVYFIVRLVTVPIAKTVQLAKAVSLGNLDEEIDVRQHDEIGVLAEAMRKMVENLKGLVEVARKIAIGDLTVNVVPLSEKDALGYSLKTMVETLAYTMTEINAAANNVAAGAHQMSSTSQAMSQGATEQASSLEEISSSMNEIASQTRHTAENARQANMLAGEAKVLAERGNEQDEPDGWRHA